MRKFAVALVLASIAVAAPSFGEIWSPARIAKVKEQIAIQEGRAAALQPIVARDITALDALQTNAAALDELVRDEAAQALEYRNLAATAPDQNTQAEFTAFAYKLEIFANLSEQSAKTHRELAGRLEESIRRMQADLNRHLGKAAELKTALANNS
ncbi:MAG: hypothetical protein NTZ61_01000 [Proteobacteria bacterium]|nr:hypothetical protein [Pseudomonadota bacterium]